MIQEKQKQLQQMGIDKEQEISLKNKEITAKVKEINDLKERLQEMAV